eukprot:gene7665-821_t
MGQRVKSYSVLSPVTSKLASKSDLPYCSNTNRYQLRPTSGSPRNFEPEPEPEPEPGSCSWLSQTPQPAKVAVAVLSANGILGAADKRWPKAELRFSSSGVISSDHSGKTILKYERYIRTALTGTAMLKGGEYDWELELQAQEQRWKLTLEDQRKAKTAAQQQQLRNHRLEQEDLGRLKRQVREQLLEEQLRETARLRSKSTGCDHHSTDQGHGTSHGHYNTAHGSGDTGQGHCNNAQGYGGSTGSGQGAAGGASWGAHDGPSWEAHDGPCGLVDENDPDCRRCGTGFAYALLVDFECASVGQLRVFLKQSGLDECSIPEGGSDAANVMRTLARSRQSSWEVRRVLAAARLPLPDRSGAIFRQRNLHQQREQLREVYTALLLQVHPDKACIAQQQQGEQQLLREKEVELATEAFRVLQQAYAYTKHTAD